MNDMYAILLMLFSLTPVFVLYLDSRTTDPSESDVVETENRFSGTLELTQAREEIDSIPNLEIKIQDYISPEAKARYEELKRKK